MLRKTLFLLFFIPVGLSNVLAQTTDHNDTLKVYLPKIDVLLKTKVEFDLESNKMRFEVRNARFGARGNINKYFGYRVEVDLSEGKIRMLDAYVKFTPIPNLDMYLGQRKVPFGSDYLRSPAENFFANRSFVAKYTNDGLRDIGFVVNYRLMYPIPFDIWVAAMNGTGNNNPQWIDEPTYAARLTFEPLRNFRLAGNFYHGSTLTEKNLTMYSGEMRYNTKTFLIESEYIHRNYADTILIKNDQYGFYIHSYYNFFTKAKMIQIISPVLRWDFMGKDEDIKVKLAERITTGVNFGFAPKPFTAEIRLNYEKYLKKYFPTHFDKFTIEFIAKF
jgi:hypothetical protein